MTERLVQHYDKKRKCWSRKKFIVWWYDKKVGTVYLSWDGTRYLPSKEKVAECLGMTVEEFVEWVRREMEKVVNHD